MSDDEKKGSIKIGNIKGNVNLKKIEHGNQSYTETNYNGNPPLADALPVKEAVSQSSAQSAATEVDTGNGIKRKEVDDNLSYRPNKRVKDGSEIYHGLYGENDLRVAVKIINKENTNTQEIIDQIEKLKGVEIHENVLELLYYYKNESKLYLALDLMTKEPWALMEYKKHGALDTTLILKQITKGLDFLHENQIVHQRFYPSNILVYDGNKVKLINFLSSSNDDEKLADRFDSIEVFRGGKKTKSSNIFTLCAIFYFVLSGGSYLFAYDEDRGNETAELIISNQPKKLPTINTHNLSMIAELMRTMMDINPESRPSTKNILQHPLLLSIDELMKVD